MWKCLCSHRMEYSKHTHICESVANSRLIWNVCHGITSLPCLCLCSSVSLSLSLDLMHLQTDDANNVLSTMAHHALMLLWLFQNIFNFIKLRFSGSHEFSFHNMYIQFLFFLPSRSYHIYKLIWIIPLYPMNKYWCSLILYHLEAQ